RSGATPPARAGGARAGAARGGRGAGGGGRRAGGFPGPAAAGGRGGGARGAGGSRPAPARGLAPRPPGPGPPGGGARARTGRVRALDEAVTSRARGEERNGDRTFVAWELVQAHAVGPFTVAALADALAAARMADVPVAAPWRRPRALAPSAALAAAWLGLCAW